MLNIFIHIAYSFSSKLQLRGKHIHAFTVFQEILKNMLLQHWQEQEMLVDIRTDYLWNSSLKRLYNNIQQNSVLQIMYLKYYQRQTDGHSYKHKEIIELFKKCHKNIEIENWSRILS